MDRRSLFVASCFALVVTSLSFGIRASILNDLQGHFALTDSQISTIAATAFWGFPISMVIGGMLVDRLGMKPMMYLAFLMHLGGILLTIFANGYMSLFLSTLMIGLGNGMVEAVCNPLVASIYPENKTTKLNHFHLWFPGGIVLGTLISFVFTNLGLDWQAQMGTMLLPLAIYGYLFSKTEFPVTERVKSGVSEADMYKNLFQPLFLFMMICMLGTAITELFTGQYIDVLLHSVSENAILILFISSGVMTLGRGLAEGVVKTLKPTGMLLGSAVVSTLGLYLLATQDGGMLFVSAAVFGLGVTFFWPTMIGFVAENLPNTGAVGLSVMGAAGMFAVSLYMQAMGGYYEGLVGDMNDVEAGRTVLRTTLFMPIVLSAAFAGLYVYMRKRNAA